MCGIAGEVRLDEGRPDITAVARMADAMQRRGPDATGVWSQGRVALGHRRLRIIDLSEHGAQPMVDAELGLTVCFNGCIYNYEALRTELIGHGYRFFSHSDTEVLIKAYHHWGDRFVERHIKLDWGPGRHGPGNNLFAFITDPDGLRIELLQVPGDPDALPGG